MLVCRAMKRVEIRLAAAIRAGSQVRAPRMSRARRVWRAVRTESYLAAAALLGGPGLAVRRRLARLGAELRARNEPDLAEELLFHPMDSVRYFEFEWAGQAVAEVAGRARSYLDVSSPRLFPLLLLLDHPALAGALANPDRGDLERTRRTAAGLRVANASFHPSRADEIDGAFDLVTSLSVLEHIPDDRAAIEAIWRRVAPGGRLVVTMPCAREAYEEHVDFDPYGLGVPESGGFHFGQRFYDEALLADRFAACGAPVATAVLGERRPGSFYEDRLRKVSGGWNPAREPLMMATEWRRYARVADLPGLGVVALAFDRPAKTAA